MKKDSSNKGFLPLEIESRKNGEKPKFGWLFMGYRQKRDSAKFLTGFTLIELMVAISIFVIVAFIVTSTLFTIISAARTANTTRLVIDNMNFALDSMGFKLKFGNNFQINGNSAVPGTLGTSLEFSDRNSTQISYCLSGGGIYQCSGGGSCSGAFQGIGQSLGDNCKRITTPEITVTELKFTLSDCPNSVKYNGVCANQQVVLLVRAEMATKGATTSLEFQSSVSQAQSQVQSVLP